MDNGVFEILRTAVSSWSGHFRSLFRSRLTFLPVAAAAIAGCLLGHIPGLPGALWAVAALGCALVAVGLSGCPRRPVLRWALPALICAIASGFAARTAWSGRESAAAALARAFPGPMVAETELRVLTPPQVADSGRSTFRAELTSLAIGEMRASVHLPVYVRWAGVAPEVGDTLAARGTLEAVGRPRNPGEFDRRAWLARQGIFSELQIAHPNDGRLLQAGGLTLLRLAARTAAWIRGTLTKGLEADSQQARLILAMTLGETRGFDPNDLEAFRNTGTLHLFSVSGLHVGMVGFLLWIVLGGIPPRLRSLLIILALFFYALVTGWKPASVRAAVMGAFVLAGLMAGRPTAILNSLLAAVVLILLGNPMELGNPGFQMSFLTVLALIVLCPPLTRSFHVPLAVDPLIPRRIFTPAEALRAAIGRRTAPSLAVVVAAWVGSLALTWVHFHIISLTAMPANAICVPLAFCIMSVSTMSLVAGVFSSALATAFNNTNWLLAGLLLETTKLLAGIPGAVLPAALPGSHRGEVIVFDVGAGSLVALDVGGKIALVDAGPASAAQQTLLPWLSQRGVRSVETLVLTHGDARHVGGALGLLERVPVRHILAGQGQTSSRSPTLKLVRKTVEARGQPIEDLQAGRQFALLPEVSAECLFHPPEHEASLADDRALVLRIEVRGWTILLLSDAGAPTLNWLMEHHPDRLPCDILIQGAHRFSVTPPEQFWKLASPRAVIATNAHFPASERIPPETHHALERLGIPLLTLDRTGAISLRLKKHSATLSPFLEPHAPTITLQREILQNQEPQPTLRIQNHPLPENSH